MRALLDTNILLDYLTEREPFYEAARQIIIDCKEKKHEGVVAAHSIVDMFYILRKHYSVVERRKMLLAFCDILSVEGIDSNKLRLALENEAFDDFEDCLQVECAKTASVDCIITRNVKDYTKTSIPVYLPSEFLDLAD